MVDYGSVSPKGDYPLKIEVSGRNIKLIENKFLKYKKFNNLNVYTIDELIKMKINAFAQRMKARDLYDLGYLIKNYKDCLSYDTIISILDNINFKVVEPLVYMLKIDIEENKLAIIDPELYIIELYESCSNRLKDLNNKLDWN